MVQYQDSISPKKEIQSEIDPNKPLLHIDINIGSEQKERITFYKGDNPAALAEEFVKKFEFDDEDGMCKMQLEQEIKLKLT